MSSSPSSSFRFCVAKSDQERKDCFSIRESVFIIEQNVPRELEMDSLDATAMHFVVYDGHGKPVAVARALDKSGGHVKLGRVAVMKSCRNQGIYIRTDSGSF